MTVIFDELKNVEQDNKYKNPEKTNVLSNKYQ